MRTVEKEKVTVKPGFESTIFQTGLNVLTVRSMPPSIEYAADWPEFQSSLIIASVGRFGRKIPFYIGGLALVGGGFGIAFTTNLITLNICRFTLGLARMAVFVNGIVIGERAQA